MEQELIQFVRTKDYKLVEEIGQGGTGRTVLLKDEHISEEFVCKKYSPYYEEHRETYYKNFVDEIKILHLLFHQNVVRVFNYYLYPEESTGYILMEYIKGHNIAKYLKKNPEKLNEIFVQVIRGFRHLEENDVLHRDIRPENILVSTNGVAKIIDFGFGKKINFNEGFDNSVSLNWRYNVPQDFENKTYNFKTEVYFVGKLFEEIIQENNLQNFAYSESYTLFVYSTNGKVKYKENIIASSLIVNIQDWSSGVYPVVIRNENQEVLWQNKLVVP